MSDQALDPEEQNWRVFVITRIKNFYGRTVGSLSVAEIERLRCTWLANVEKRWGDPVLDDDIRAHYWVIMRRVRHDRNEAGIQQRPTNLVNLPESPAPQAAVARVPLGHPLAVQESQSVPGMPPVPPLARKDIAPVENQLSNALVNFEFGSEIYVVGNPRESWEPPPVGPTCVNCGADFRFCFDWAVSRWVPTEVRCNCETDSRRPIKLVTEMGAHEEGGRPSDPSIVAVPKISRRFPEKETTHA